MYCQGPQKYCELVILVGTDSGPWDDEAESAGPHTGFLGPSETWLSVHLLSGVWASSFLSCGETLDPED